MWHPLNPPRSSCCPAAVSTTWFLMSDGFPMWAGFYWWLKHSIICLHPEHLTLVLWGWTLSRCTFCFQPASVGPEYLSPFYEPIHLRIHLNDSRYSPTLQKPCVKVHCFIAPVLTSGHLYLTLMDFQTSANCFALVYACFLRTREPKTRYLVETGLNLLIDPPVITGMNYHGWRKLEIFTFIL